MSWRERYEANLQGIIARDALRNTLRQDDPHADWLDAARAREERQPRLESRRRASSEVTFGNYMRKNYRLRLWPLRRDLRWLEGEAARFGLTLEEAVIILLR